MVAVRRKYGLTIDRWEADALERVLKDSVRAHMWYTLAGDNGNEQARRNRDMLERDMTRAEISRSTELACACRVSDYQDCQQ